MDKDAQKNAAMLAAADTLTTLKGVVEGLEITLRQERDKNDGLALTLESLKEDNAALQEKAAQLSAAALKPQPETDADLRKTLEKKLSFYYRDMQKIDPQTITAEDGETLFHILEYTFKALKKAGLELE